MTTLPSYQDLIDAGITTHERGLAYAAFSLAEAIRLDGPGTAEAPNLYLEAIKIASTENSLSLDIRLPYSLQTYYSTGGSLLQACDVVSTQSSGVPLIPIPLPTTSLVSQGLTAQEWISDYATGETKVLPTQLPDFGPGVNTLERFLLRCAQKIEAYWRNSDPNFQQFINSFEGTRWINGNPVRITNNQSTFKNGLGQIVITARLSVDIQLRNLADNLIQGLWNARDISGDP